MGRHHHHPLGERLDLSWNQLEAFAPLQGSAHRRSELFSINRQGITRRHPVRIGAGEDHRPQLSQLGVEHSNRAFRVVGAKGVAAHQLSERVGLVGRRPSMRLHFPQGDRVAA